VRQDQALPIQCNPQRKRSKGEEEEENKMQKEEEEWQEKKEEEKLVFYLQFLKFTFENSYVHVS
jgi:hypothetical protein